MGAIYEMNSQGDGLKLEWDPAKPKDVKAARETFEMYRERGHTMFRMDEDDEQGEPMTTFDPAAGKILAVPRVAGG